MKMKQEGTARQPSMEQYGFGPQAMKKWKVCGQCGTMAHSSQQFCRECGHRLPQKTLYDVYKSMHKVCPDCDSVAPDGAEFCPVCGMRLKKEVV